MDILYVIGTGSKWANNEIRYSLRSVAKFGTNVGRIFVCGANPRILSDEVIFVPCDDPYDHCAHKNIMHKIDYVIKNTDISDEFLLSSDDHFFVKPVDFDKYPIYAKGIMPARSKDKSPYQLSLVETRKLLIDAGLPTLLTNPHCDTHISRDVWQQTAALRVAAMSLPHGGEVNCIIGNTMIENGAKPELYRDVKIGTFSGRAELLEQIGDSHCFSIYDSAIHAGIEEYLLSLFPEPSKYERVSAAQIERKQKNALRRVEYQVRKGNALVTRYKYI